MQLGEFLTIPLLLPGLGASIVAAPLLGGLVRRMLRTGPVLGWALVVTLGLILSATLTPSRAAIDLGAVGSRTCDLSRVGLITADELLQLGDTSLNVLLFLPLGVVLGLVPRSRRKAVIVAGAVALPFAIEAAQALVPWLDRACQGADVVDNLTGLVSGLAIGAATGQLAGAVRRRAS